MKNETRGNEKPVDGGSASAPAKDDGLLDSLGKAITDPMKSGAEEEEPRSDGTLPEAPGP